jgi:hypothetical protein
MQLHADRPSDEVTAMPATTGMKGAGYYDRHSSAQRASIEALQGWIEDAVARLPLPAPPQTVTLLDLGSSEGRNAIHVMRSIVKGLRRRTRQPIQTVFSDLTSNNFNQLFANLGRAQPPGSSPAAVYPSAVGGSFYGPLLPPGTVHLATSFNAIQWLDQLPPVPLPNRVVYRRPDPPRPGLVVPRQVSAAFERQAYQDLTRFLECRAWELVSGGKLLLASPGDTDQACVADGLADVLNDACRDLVAAGQLEPAAYERLTMPVYFRTVPELLAPLDRKDSPVYGLFVVDWAQALEVPAPFGVEVQPGGDAAAYADAFTGFARAITEPIVRAALNQPAQQARTVDALYERLRVRLLEEPEHYFWRYIVVAALLTRR